MIQTRKQFIQSLGLTVASCPSWTCRLFAQSPSTATSTSAQATADSSVVPSYLRGFEELYRKDPKAAAIQWHRQSNWGMFVHYALASLRGLTAEQSLKAKDGNKDGWKTLKQGTPEEFLQLKAQLAKPNIILAMADDMGWADPGLRAHHSHRGNVKWPGKRIALSQVSLQ